MITTTGMRALRCCVTAVRVPLVSMLLSCFTPWALSADVILVGGHIYTADAPSREAEAVVIEGNTIVYVGSRPANSVYASLPASSKVIELPVDAAKPV